MVRLMQAAQMQLAWKRFLTPSPMEARMDHAYCQPNLSHLLLQDWLDRELIDRLLLSGSICCAGGMFQMGFLEVIEK